MLIIYILQLLVAALESPLYIILKLLQLLVIVHFIGHMDPFIA